MQTDRQTPTLRAGSGRNLRTMIRHPLKALLGTGGGSSGYSPARREEVIHRDMARLHRDMLRDIGIDRNRA